MYHLRFSRSADYRVYITLMIKFNNPYLLFLVHMQLQFEVLFSYFVFVFIEALPLSLEVSQVLTLLEDLSFFRKDQPRILVSLVLKGLRRNQTTKLGHLLKQRCNYFHGNRMISHLLSIYSLRINIIMFGRRLLISSRLRLF